MAGKISCCYQCTDRFVGCHSSCSKYQEERKALNEFNKAVYRENNKNYFHKKKY